MGKGKSKDKMGKEKTNQGSLPLPVFQSVWETKGIFSDHYIRTKLQNTSLWPNEEKIKPIYEFCYELWDKRYVGLANANEAVTRQELLDKILTKLGFSYLPNTPFPMGGEPDYILFSDDTTKEQVLDKNKHTQYSAAISILEAKKVNHPLDAVSKQETPGKFPHQQIKEYLHSATDLSGKPYFKWAILTNGNKWRLYCRDAHPDQYFEFDFKHGIRSFKDFMVFATLFNPAAFIKDEEGHCLLDVLRSEALSCQAELEDNLCKRVFNILENLANGFYKRSENKITKNDLGRLYENCLIFLYRLLFILYAEGRALLPVKPSGTGSNKNYRERYSLQRLFTRFRNPRNYISDDFTDLYEEILGLFHLINGDQPVRNKACDVPLYDGRLFDPKKYELLEQWRIGEQTLADVLKGLMFGNIPTVRGEQRALNFGETIDYADLEVRQLGSIYEGLLENHLAIEEDRLVLRGDKSERKATGTYYTPDYIVQYIVKKTLEPLCNKIHESKKVQTAIKKDIPDNSFAEEVLKLKVLDPAMGSGHFLVRATEFLAEQILYHPTTALQVETIPRGLSHEQAEISYWRRKVVESCIYGVDLNPLAVELTKLSLWLTCITTDQPLSFLDHHLRVGNSLIGAKLDDLGSLSKGKTSQQLLFSFGPDLLRTISEAIQTLKEIEGIESKDIPAVKNKAQRWHKEVWEKLKPYRTIADLWTMSSFDMKIDEETYCKLAQLLSGNSASRTKKAKELKQKIKPYESYLKTAEEEKKFFHWEFEFPEVFFNEDGTIKENSGFDAVIGNPPYVRVDNIDSEIKQFYKKFYFSAQGKYDLYYLFFEKALALSPKGILSFITPNKYCAATSACNLRGLLFKNSSGEIVSTSMLDVFKDAANYPVISVLSRIFGENLKVRQALSLESVSESTCNFHEINLSDLSKFPGKVVPINTTQESINFVIRLLSVNKKMSMWLNISEGLRIPEKYQFAEKSDFIIVKQFQFERYSNIARGAYILANNLREVVSEESDRFQKIIKAKILIAEDALRISATLDENYLVPQGGVYFGTLVNSAISLEGVLAILNSKLLSFVYKVLYGGMHMGGGYLRFRSNCLNELPVPEISDSENKKLKNLVAEMLTLTKHGNSIDENVDDKIDQMVYKLYGLTEEEIKIVEGNENRQ